MSSFRILVVDDDVDMTTSCVKLFRKQGYIAEYLTSGEAALDTLRRDEAFHVLLTDIKLGTMDGVNLMRQSQSEFPQISYSDDGLWQYFGRSICNKIRCF